jgi:hypothetical protein
LEVETQTFGQLIQKVRRTDAPQRSFQTTESQPYRELASATEDFPAMLNTTRRPDLWCELCENA